MLSYVTSGESHGHYLTAILEGMPSGLKVDMDTINGALRKRQGGYGRGGRQKIEKDAVEMTGGVIKGLTTGAPLGFLLTNKDFKIDQMPDLERPRPGHADLTGALKYDQGIRPVLERASARETAMRVAVGAMCQTFLREFGIHLISHVVQIGGVRMPDELPEISAEEMEKKVNASDLRCLCPDTEKKMVQAIDEARRKKDTLGGRFEIRITGLPAGLGSYVHYERKLDARLAYHLMGMQSIKAVEIGKGVELGAVFGSEAHDEIFYDAKKGYYRKTLRAGGIEGGMSVGSDICVRVTMKPISTLAKPLKSVNMKTKKAEEADFERSDTCAVAAGSLIGESIAAFVIADAFLEKFGGDSLKEIKRNYEGYKKQIREA